METVSNIKAAKNLFSEYAKSNTTQKRKNKIIDQLVSATFKNLKTMDIVIAGNKAVRASENNNYRDSITGLTNCILIKGNQS